MTKKLIAIRLRGLMAGLLSAAAKKGKRSKGMAVFLTVALLYALVASGFMMGMNFYALAQPYHRMGLDWLYFSMAGMMALSISVLGSAFTTQSQLYDAKDNALLLSMPIPAGKILTSRMVPLLLMNLLFTSIVMIPAMVVYGIWVEFRFTWLLLQLLALAAVVLLSQAISCILGWLLHLMLMRLSKSVASFLYMAIFLGLYFYLISNAQNLLNVLITSSGTIADALSTWVWPLYAMGRGSVGSLLHAPVFPAVGCAVFAIVYAVLSATFVKSAARTPAASKKRALNLSRSKQTVPREAIVRKELYRFLRTPIYLTNSGLGLLLLAGLTAAGLIFRNDLLELLAMLPGGDAYIPLLICGVIAFTVSTNTISTPSVSLEGKNIWILKSLPLSAKEILLAKLALHCRIAIPLPVIAGGLLAAAYGCGIWDILLCAVIPGLLALFSGVLGMVSGLKWAQLDYISEAYPCKQSVSIVISMFGIMGLAILLGFGCVFLEGFLSLRLLMAMAAALLIILCCIFYRCLISWGPKKWESL